MKWLGLGILYSGAYAVCGWLLRDRPGLLSEFRAVALLVPPLTAAIVIVLRRRLWSGCQWLFWATVALGLAMSAAGLMGWAADELIFEHAAWLAWPSVFALFGGIAPLFALLAQPHRGTREPLAATTAVDIAGLAVVTGFLYSFFVLAQSTPGAPSLVLLSELQQGFVLLGMIAAMAAARHTPWRVTYQRLALGALVAFITLTLSNLEAGAGLYRSGFVYDFTWILPFSFFPWALDATPASESQETTAAEQDDLKRPRPWVIFASVALLPFLDHALREIAPVPELNAIRNLTMAVTFLSVLPLLIARIAAERVELQRADTTMRLLEHAIEQAQDAILITRVDGKFSHANAAFCRALGVSRSELVSRRLRDLMSDQDVSASDIQRAVTNGRTWRGTLTRTRVDGTTFPAAATVAALRDESGEVTHIVSVERDISEERRLREQLIHSERLSAVGQLVSGVAHELNNPLQGVMGMTELLLENERRPDVRRDLEQVRADGSRAAGIVKSLLAFARRSALERSVTDLNELMRATLSLRAYELRLASISIDEQYTSDLPLVLINREEIQQVVMSLVLNAEHAIHESDKGSGVIGVRTWTSGAAISIDVFDSGPGVPAELAGRVFEPFFTTKPNGEGSGLGLSLSLGIAEAHGGTLTLTPASTGACFTLTLPATVVVSVAGRSPISPAA
jgi:PAS domain S-box-containing protein